MNTLLGNIRVAMTVHFSRLRIAALATVVAVAAVAPAQTPNPWGFKLGIIFPVSKDVRDTAGKTGFDIGASYQLTSKPLIPGQTTASVDLDYFRVGGTGTYGESVAIGYAERSFFGGPEAESGPYAGFEVGIGFNKVKATVVESGQSGGQISTSRTEQRVQVIGEILVGYKINKQIGLEAFYRLQSKIEGVDINTYGIRVGYKF